MPPVSPHIPQIQTQLLLHQARRPYQTFHEGPIPQLHEGELLVEVFAVGLNPIDWKSAYFGFALPQLPCLNGREFIGRVVKNGAGDSCRLAVGDQVLAVSTDYRDYRKSGFQEYAVVCCFNAIKIPDNINPYMAASLGVAFVTASIALGVCLGIQLPPRGNLSSMDVLAVAQEQDPMDIPSDCLSEVFEAISIEERPRAGDWILIYGASTVTAQVCIQLAKMAGLKVIGIADRVKHHERLTPLGVDVLLDRFDLDQAARDIQTHTEGNLRFALDMIGKDTASWCHEILDLCAASQPLDRDMAATGGQCHLVCLTGAPKSPSANVRIHKVPVKLFHTNEILGCKLSYWLYHSLKNGMLKIPEAKVVEGGLGVINSCLEQMRRGEISGSRLVVKLR